MSHPIIHIGQQEKVYIGDIDANGDPVLTTGGLELWPAGTAVNNATVTGQVRAADGVNGAPGTAIGAAITLTNVGSSSGHYTGTIPAATTLLLTAGTIYHVWVTGSSGEVYRKLVYKAGYAGEKG